MKKILFFVAAILFAAAGFDATAQLSYDPACQKIAKKQAKNKVKEMKQKKWEYSGSMAMEDKLQQYYLKTGDCGLYNGEVKDATRAKTITTGEGTAMQALTAEIAQGLFQKVAGGATTEINSDQAEWAGNKMRSLYQGDISACIERAMTFYKKNMDGTLHVQVFFLINKARKEQLENKVLRDFDGDRWQKIMDDIDKAHGK